MLPTYIIKLCKHILPSYVIWLKAFYFHLCNKFIKRRKDIYFKGIGRPLGDKENIQSTGGRYNKRAKQRGLSLFFYYKIMDRIFTFNKAYLIHKQSPMVNHLSNEHFQVCLQKNSLFDFRFQCPNCFLLEQNWIWFNEKQTCFLLITFLYLLVKTFQMHCFIRVRTI